MYLQCSMHLQCSDLLQVCTIAYTTDPHTRVPLFLKFGVANSDYVNANYIRVS